MTFPISMTFHHDLKIFKVNDIPGTFLENTSFSRP